MSSNHTDDEQPTLFPEDEAKLIKDETPEPSPGVSPEVSSGGGGKQFSALAPLPDGDDVPISVYAERAYLEYAISVVKGRALPDVCDGQKPVQRRILYAMRQMGLSHGNKHVKSARVVGDVLGKYHPHGDASAYDAMVRLAQSFSLRYPLVDGQGNFGSRDGDNAAAMRYTETRLTPLADLLLSELDMGTVDFVPNYDGAFKEPSMLPARLPMVLLNGASGIAVGMATEIPSHNLREVASAAVQLVRDPEFSDDSLLACIPGPDFPAGGQIISSPRELRDGYLSGRGSIKMRARWTVEELARGQWQIVVHELPHGVSTKKVLEEIDDLSNPKVRANKKSLSPEQVQNKQLLLSVLDSVADESDKSQAVRLVFQPKSSRQTQDELLNVLLAHTSLESSTSLNLTMIGLDGRPQQKSLTQIIREWVEFRLSTVRRRSQHRLGQVNDRLHILAGRMVVFLNIDEVIKIIREADDAKAALIERFELSDRQAEDILEIRLRQLARMEGIRIEKEIKQLDKEAKELNRLLSKDSALREQVAKEIDADTLSFGDERRTLILEAQRAAAANNIVDEPVTVVISKKHWGRTRQGHGLDLSALSFKDGDGMLAQYECRTTDHCIAICDNGRVCSIPVSQLPSGRGDGVPLSTLIEIASGAKIAHVLCGKAEQHVLIASAAGYGFTAQLGDMVGRNKAGKQFINVDKEAILPPTTYTPGEQSLIAAASSDGRLLVFMLSEMKHLRGGGKGVIVMGLAEGAELTVSKVIKQGKIEVRGTTGTREHSVKISAETLQSYFGKRARGGKVIQARFKPKHIE